MAGSVLVVGEGTAGKSEALGALSSGVSSNGDSSDGPYPSPGCTSSAPMSTACFPFSSFLPSGPRTDRPLKAALNLPEKHPSDHLRALKVQAPQVQIRQQVWVLALALLVPLRALLSRQCPSCPSCILLPFSGVSLDVLVVLHGVAGTQRLKFSATRKLKQAVTVDCFDDIV